MRTSCHRRASGSRGVTWRICQHIPALALTQDLSGEASRLLDDIWDCQCHLTSRAPIGDAMCVEKLCSGRCLDRKIYVLRHVPAHCIQLAYNDTNQLSARVENRAATASGLHGSGVQRPGTLHGRRDCAQVSGAISLIAHAGCSLTALLMISSGGSRPVQIRNDSAPCWTRISSPSTKVAPPLMHGAASSVGSDP